MGGACLLLLLSMCEYDGRWKTPLFMVFVRFGGCLGLRVVEGLVRGHLVRGHLVRGHLVQCRGIRSTTTRTVAETWGRIAFATQVQLSHSNLSLGLPALLVSGSGLRCGCKAFRQRELKRSQKSISRSAAVLCLTDARLPAYDASVMMSGLLIPRE